MIARYGRARRLITTSAIALAVGLALSDAASAQTVEPDRNSQQRPADPPSVADQAAQAARAADTAREQADLAVRAAGAARAAESASANYLTQSDQTAQEVRRSESRARRAADRAEAAADDSARSPVLPSGCSAGDEVLDRFRQGVSWSRRCARNYIRSLRRDGLMAGDAEWRQVLNGSEALNDFYLARSNRQQAIIDFGSGVTGTGALGAGLSAAAGPHTVLMWGYGALAGVMIVEFSGSQPTRDLYSAGHIGVGYIVNRYSVLYGSLQQLENADRPDLPQACGAPGTPDSASRRLAVVEAWAGGDDKTAFLPVLRRLADTCRRLHQGEGDMDAMVRRTARGAEAWPTALASDLLSLDDQISDKDARLRMTPANALTAAAVGPLRLLDSLISGENTQEALGRLRINALLDDMTVSLTPVRVQAPPSAIDGVIELTPDFETRAAASGRPAPPNPPVAGAPVQPDNAAIGDMATWVRERLPLIETARQRHNDRVFYANELSEAARRSVLHFDYQVATGAAEVQLAAPAADGGTSAAAKDDGRQVMPQPAS